jgi:hypothetical protein
MQFNFRNSIYYESIDIIKNQVVKSLVGENIKIGLFVRGYQTDEFSSIIYSISGATDKAKVYLFYQNINDKLSIHQLSFVSKKKTELVVLIGPNKTV